MYQPKGFTIALQLNAIEILLNYPWSKIVVRGRLTHKALVWVHGKIELNPDGVGHGNKRGSLLMVQKGSKAMMGIIPFMGDESKRLNYPKLICS